MMTMKKKSSYDPPVVDSVELIQETNFRSGDASEGSSPNGTVNQWIWED